MPAICWELGKTKRFFQDFWVQYQLIETQYCNNVTAITYNNFGSSGQFNRVTNMDGCQTSPQAYSGSLAPFDDEVRFGHLFDCSPACTPWRNDILIKVMVVDSRISRTHSPEAVRCICSQLS